MNTWNFSKSFKKSEEILHYSRCRLEMDGVDMVDSVDEGGNERLKAKG